MVNIQNPHVFPMPPADPPSSDTIPAPDHPPEFGVPEAPPMPVTPALPGERFAPGTLLTGRYRIVAALGKGGMGEVYRADDLMLAQPVALKFLPPHLASDPLRLDGFRKEVAAARRVSHPNVCRVYDISEHDGQPFLTMEFIDGEDLASLLRRVGRLSEEKSIDVSRQLCAALAAVHAQGLLHRDLKPANLMLDGRGRVRLTDFGLAAAEQDVSATQVRYGTPVYQAPEQAAGKEVTVRSDIFALGLIIYELFTGKRAYADGSRDTPLTAPSSHVAWINPHIERLILRCLERDPAQRPQSVSEVLVDLPGGDPLAEALAAGVTPSPQVVAAASVTGRLSYLRGGLLLAGVIVGLVVFLMLYDRVMLVGMVGLPEPTDSLSRRCRDVFLLAGLSDRVDAIGFDHDQQFLNYHFDPADPATWNDRVRKRPVSPIFFWCRQAPAPFAPDLFYPYAGSLEPPRTTWTDPGPIVPRMASVKVDVRGRLLEFVSLPHDLERHPKPPLPPPNRETWDRWFERAGFDFNRFEPATSEWVPAVYADTRYAWVGSTENPNDLPIRVEAGTYRGHMVSFQVVAPWTRRDIGDPTQGVGGQGAAVSPFLVFLPLVVAIFILAPRHLRSGQADGAGAFHLGVLVFILQIVVWACEVRHHFDGYAALRLEVRSLVLGLAFSLYWAALIAGSYLALEPLVRRWWPEAVISWTRLLGGRWRDPLVGRDVLVGVLGGVLILVVGMIGNLVPQWLGEPAAIPWWDWRVPNTRVPGYWAGTLLGNLVYSFRTAFFYNLLLLLLLRQLFGKPAFYGTAYVLLWVAIKAHEQDLLTNSPGGWLSVVLSLLFFALSSFGMLWLLVRYGALAVIVAAFVMNTLWFPMTLDANVSLANAGILVLIVVVAMAGYGFHMASRPAD